MVIKTYHKQNQKRKLIEEYRVIHEAIVQKIQEYPNLQGIFNARKER
jgi:hypothetical protein